MRPEKIWMTAFGSYKNETEVDLERMGRGLYLITGETGSGKTTIFDAVLFALYGAVGGEHRKADMMHSDYVPRDVDTVVRLRFEHGGREYLAERRIHYRKKRSSEGEYTDFQIRARLEDLEDPARSADGATEVTDRIRELLGLNCAQFQQIVMLAQGEFRRFLDADSGERSEILGRLFDSSPYRRMQERLKRASDLMKDRLREQDGELRDLMKRFMMPGELTAEEQALFGPDHPRLPESLKELTARDTAVCAAAEEKLKAAEGKRDRLIGERAAAERNNER